MATLEQIRKLLQEQKTDIVTSISEKITALDDKITSLTTISNNHTTQLTSHETRLAILEKDMQLTIEKQEDQINRSLRNNIVLKNVEGDEKAWEETKLVVAKILCRLEGDDPQNADSYLSAIERAHRGKRSDQQRNRSSPRTIYARLYCSEDVKNYVDKARLLRIANKNFQITVEQQFSELVQKRRNTAKMKRKELVANKEIVSGFVEYPTKLMIKRDGDLKYTLFEAF